MKGKSMRRYRKAAGSALAYVLIFVFLASVLCASILLSTTTQLGLNRNTQEFESKYYSAETVAQIAVSEVERAIMAAQAAFPARMEDCGPHPGGGPDPDNPARYYFYDPDPDDSSIPRPMIDVLLAVPSEIDKNDPPGAWVDYETGFEALQSATSIRAKTAARFAVENVFYGVGGHKSTPTSFPSPVDGAAIPSLQLIAKQNKVKIELTIVGLTESLKWNSDDTDELFFRSKLIGLDLNEQQTYHQTFWVYVYEMIPYPQPPPSPPILTPIGELEKLELMLYDYWYTFEDITVETVALDRNVEIAVNGEIGFVTDDEHSFSTETSVSYIPGVDPPVTWGGDSPIAEVSNPGASHGISAGVTFVDASGTSVPNIQFTDALASGDTEPPDGLGAAAADAIRNGGDLFDIAEGRKNILMGDATRPGLFPGMNGYNPIYTPPFKPDPDAAAIPPNPTSNAVLVITTQSAIGDFYKSENGHGILRGDKIPANIKTIVFDGVNQPTLIGDFDNVDIYANRNMYLAFPESLPGSVSAGDNKFAMTGGNIYCTADIGMAARHGDLSLNGVNVASGGTVTFRGDADKMVDFGGSIFYADKITTSEGAVAKSTGSPIAQFYANNIELNNFSCAGPFNAIFGSNSNFALRNSDVNLFSGGIVARNIDQISMNYIGGHPAVLNAFPTIPGNLAEPNLPLYLGGSGTPVGPGQLEDTQTGEIEGAPLTTSDSLLTRRIQGLAP